MRLFAALGATCASFATAMPTVKEMLKPVPAVANLTIVGVELIMLNTAPFVHVTTSDGLVGLGQASYGEDANESIAIATFLQEEIAPRVIGLPAGYPPYVQDRLLWDNYKTTGALLFRSASGIDTALWDLAGKRAGKYVTELAGGVVAPVAVYGSSIDRQIDAAGLAAKVKRVHETYGVNAFKVKVAQRMGNNTDVWPNRSSEVVEAVRSAVGPDVSLMADANGGWTTAEKAWPMAQLLDALNFTWFEEPVVFWEYGEDVKLVNLMKQSGFERLRVAAGEQEYRSFLLQYGYTNGLDPIQPDVGYSGGFTTVLEVARGASQVPAHIDLHSPNPCLNLVMTMHLTLAAPNRMPWMELTCVDNGIPNAGQYFENWDVKLVNGQMQFPTGGAGWGVTLRKSAADQATVRWCVGECADAWAG